jgi:hypothetical protein
MLGKSEQFPHDTMKVKGIIKQIQSLTMEKSVTFTGACANDIIPSINRSFVYKVKEGGDVRIHDTLYMITS